MSGTRTRKTILRRSTDKPMAKDKNFLSLENRDKAFDTIKYLKEDKGMTYEEIAEHLTAQGWRGAKGASISQPVLTRFMRAMGYKVYAPIRANVVEAGTGAIRAEPELKIVPKKGQKTPPSGSKLEQEVIELLRTDMAKEMKLKFMKSLLEEYEDKDK